MRENTFNSRKPNSPNL